MVLKQIWRGHSKDGLAQVYPQTQTNYDAINSAALECPNFHLKHQNAFNWAVHGMSLQDERDAEEKGAEVCLVKARK